MTDTESLERRFQELEMHMANQEGVVQDLSDAVAGQWDVIHKLSQSVAHLKDRLASVEDAVPNIPGEEPPPPHY